jgi:hypothetical protein
MPRESDAALQERIRYNVPLPAIRHHAPVYAWDLDSTVASTVHRRHLVDAIRVGESTWDSYAMMCADDTPIAGSVALMHELGGIHIVVSGRSAGALDLTEAWFRQHNVPIRAALLRQQGDHTPNGIYKVRVLKTMLEMGVNVRLFFEDWGEVAVQIAAETGIPVVGINPFDPEELGERQGAI